MDDPFDSFQGSLWPLALAEAFRWHDGQTRKSTGLPYVIHCVEVAWILRSAGFDEDVVIAGLLHDTLEDTAMPAERITEIFGPAVLEIVQALTERKCDDTGAKRPWIDRKREHIEHLKSSSHKVRAVALADQRQNLSSVLTDWKRDDRSFWNDFNAQAKDYANYHRKRFEASDSGESALRPLSNSVRELLRRLDERIAEELPNAPAKFDYRDWA